MSTTEDLRAMREAKYARARAMAAGSAPAPAPAPTRATAKKPAAKKPAVERPADAATSGDALCGHRNMSGRTCTRELGHAAKSHRYS